MLREQSLEPAMTCETGIRERDGNGGKVVQAEMWLKKE